MHSDDSIQTVFDTNNNVTNPAIDTLDEFLDTEPSPNNQSQPPFAPITSPHPAPPTRQELFFLPSF